MNECVFPEVDLQSEDFHEARVGLREILVASAKKGNLISARDLACFVALSEKGRYPVPRRSWYGPHRDTHHITRDRSGRNV